MVERKRPRAWVRDHVRPRAAVAVIQDRDERVLFIQRPRRRGDRWSGDIAFPGGMARPGELPVETAAREAHEEVGLRLKAPSGWLSPRLTSRPDGPLPMWVQPVRFEIDATALQLDRREVERAFWIPLAQLRRKRLTLALRRIARLPVPVPSLDLDGEVLWGLTLSMVLELRASS